MSHMTDLTTIFRYHIFLNFSRCNLEFQSFYNIVMIKFRLIPVSNNALFNNINESTLNASTHIILIYVFYV